MDNPDKKKKGRLSEVDKAFIDAKMNILSVEDIAVQLNRKPETIQKYNTTKTNTETKTVARKQPKKKLRGNEIVDNRIGKTVGAISTKQFSEKGDDKKHSDLAKKKNESHIHRIF